nr:shugoshin [Quercus suber]
MRTKSRQPVQPPVTDLDEVKRRFIRQNRELAKNNSTQSLRIRHLEIEVGRLQSDNLELREQVLQLQGSLDRAHVGVGVQVVEKIRDELKAKLTELGYLVAGLDNGIRNAQPLQVARSLGTIEGQWRDRQPLMDAMRDSQLPTINEDKLYPRRTLDAAEIQSARLSDLNSNGSPDLGSPPIAHFDYEDEEKPPSPLIPNSADGFEDDIIPTKLYANLETRRSRKGELSKIQVRRGSLLAQSPTKAEPETTALILRTGTKRKLAETDSEPKPAMPPIGEDFNFTRRGAKMQEVAEATNATIDPKISTDAYEGYNDMRQRPVRKVLGDKSTNISPRKVQLSEKTGKPRHEDLPKSEHANARRKSRARRVSSLPLPSSPGQTIPTIEAAPLAKPATFELALETPAGLQDLFSPTPSACSTSLNENRDTPPPATLNTTGRTLLEGRPSRRARSAVNYTEPSLVAKMRRPRKELADAISGLQDPRLAMSNTAKTDKAFASHKVAYIKREPQDDGDEDCWDPLVPAATSELLGPLKSRSTKGLASDAEVYQPGGLPVEPSSPSVVSQTRPRASGSSREVRQDTQELDEHELGTTVEKLEDLGIFEFNESSSPPAVTKKQSQRRQSSVSKSFQGTPQEGEAKDRLPGTVRRERSASRRKSMML